ncbi:MAG: hypothetical protein NT117_00150 [Gammaproteobacteria bacterium]|nr:hypothetical protein [Gammaproteobacteria bacterium]
MTDELPAIAGLTQEEATFVYNTEYLQLPMRTAAQMAGMPLGRIKAPHIIQARELAKKAIRGATQISKEDVVFGMHEAVGRARILGEPMTEIAGWKEIAKLLGYDTPAKIDINIKASVDALQQSVRTMTDADLIESLGAGSIIDAEFYVINEKDQ